MPAAIWIVFIVLLSHSVESVKAQDESRRTAVETSTLTSFENAASFVALFKAVGERSCFKVATLTDDTAKVALNGVEPAASCASGVAVSLGVVDDLRDDLHQLPCLLSQRVIALRQIAGLP